MVDYKSFLVFRAPLSKYLFTASILTLSMLFPLDLPSAFAEPLVIEADARGKSVEFTLNESHQRDVKIVIPIRNPEQQTLRLGIQAPNKTAISVTSGMSGTDPLKSAVAGKGAQSLLYTGGAERGTKRITITSGVNQTDSSSSIGDTSCGCLGENEIQELIQSFAMLGMNYSREDVCAYMASIMGGFCGGGGNLGAGTPLFEGLGFQASAFLQRDACSKQEHFAVIHIDLKKVDQSAFDSETTIKVEFDISRFTGNRRASIKPEGEGKYKMPLLLAGPVGSSYSFGGNISGLVRLTSWRGGRKRSDRRVRIADFVYYNGGGGTLWRVPLNRSLMRGGRGTFELRNNAEGYSICATLSPTRQYFNGYFNN